MEIYIRELQESDAIISYKWRNNPNIWKLTGSSPDKIITFEIENEWIRDVLSRENERRFAICISGTNQYIGNVQLTHIENGEAEFHIFIGEEGFWGKGIGTMATKLLIQKAFDKLKLNLIYLFVRDNNLGAIKAYEKSGFHIDREDNGMIKMSISKMQ